MAATVIPLSAGLRVAVDRITVAIVEVVDTMAAAFAIQLATRPAASGRHLGNLRRLAVDLRSLPVALIQSEIEGLAHDILAEDWPEAIHVLADRLLEGLELHEQAWTMLLKMRPN